jgi:hypothetical protein
MTVNNEGMLQFDTKECLKLRRRSWVEALEQVLRECDRIERWTKSSEFGSGARWALNELRSQVKMAIDNVKED